MADIDFFMAGIFKYKRYSFVEKCLNGIANTNVQIKMKFSLCIYHIGVFSFRMQDFKSNMVILIKYYKKTCKEISTKVLWVLMLYY